MTRPAPAGAAPAPSDNPALGRALADWFAATRRDLPWRRPEDRADPWRELVSELMLQQTRVATAIPYYERFVARFPDPAALAAASEEEVLAAWKGLGYYSRARNLRRAAQEIVREHGGRVPSDFDALRALPGVGDYTAGAVRSIAFGIATPAVDGNVLRVLARHDGLADDVAAPATRRRIADRTQALSPPGRAADFCEGLMELGATVCLPTAPLCPDCPWRATCRALADGRIEALPVKRPKPAPAVEERDALVVRAAGRVLLERRGKGLFEGMWGFPDAADSADAFAARTGVRPDLAAARDAGRVEHVFTHRRWRLRVRVCGIEGADAAAEAGAAVPARPAGLPDARPPFRWADEAEIPALAVPKAFQKVWAAACAAPAVSPVVYRDPEAT